MTPDEINLMYTRMGLLFYVSSEGTFLYGRAGDPGQKRVDPLNSDADAFGSSLFGSSL